MKHLFFTVALTVVSCALNGSAQTPATTEASASDFVQVVDGHLSVGGKRLKLWGAQSSLFGEHYAQIDNEVKHFRKLGFNLYRSISVGYPYSLESKRGDESFIDLMDYQFNAIAQSGGYNWIDLAN
ncbi:MAG: hypothetical protein IT446_11810, partial [Phycisphaerales bacterium]|nr:hypothetical protein [Phycisphaerales bacterium]